MSAIPRGREGLVLDNRQKRFELLDVHEARSDRRRVKIARRCRENSEGMLTLLEIRVTREVS